MAKVKLTKDYFTDNEVLIIGYPLQDDPSMKMILKAFLDNGIKVYALNEKAAGDADIKLYRSIAELPRVPKCAYIWADKAEIDGWIQPLKEAGVERVLYHSKKDVDPAQVEATRTAGMAAAIACPMMLLGRGLHRLHGKLAGVI